MMEEQGIAHKSNLCDTKMDEIGELSDIFHELSQSLGFHIIKATPDKSLSNGYSYSYASLLIKDLKREISVNQSII